MFIEGLYGGDGGVIGQMQMVVIQSDLLWIIGCVEQFEEVCGGGKEQCVMWQVSVVVIGFVVVVGMDFMCMLLGEVECGDDDVV